MLGIVKAYTTRVGTGPFPTELTDDVGARLAQARQRVRLGHRPAAPLRLARRCRRCERSLQLNGVDGLCITKLDVLDGLDEMRICTGYTVDGEPLDLLPSGADAVAECVPVYETLPGWSESTVGVQDASTRCRRTRAPTSQRIEALTGVPIAMVSTGPDRDETILRAPSRSTDRECSDRPEVQPTNPEGPRVNEPARHLGPVPHARSSGSR